MIYWRLREHVSFLMAEGHRHAARYPLGRLWAEEEIARRRVNQQTKTDALLIHSAIAAVLGNDAKHLNESLDKLDG